MVISAEQLSNGYGQHSEGRYQKHPYCDILFVLFSL